MSQATRTNLQAFVRRDLNRKRLKCPDVCRVPYSETVEDVMDLILQNRIRNMRCQNGNTKDRSNAYAT